MALFSQFFSTVQEAKWYAQFLDPVLELIPKNSYLLDIGTGSGKMLALLAEKKSVKSVGVDTNEDMLKEARKKIGNLPVELFKIEPNSDLQFPERHFDTVTICNVLFHMNQADIFKMLDESRRVLKVDGQIIILSPTGKGGIIKLMSKFFRQGTKTMLVWYRATKNNGKKWTEKKVIKEYCDKNKLAYSHKFTLQGFAQIEVISKR